MAYYRRALWMISFFLNYRMNYPALLARDRTGRPLLSLALDSGRLTLYSDGSWGLGLILPLRRLCSISSSERSSLLVLPSFPLFFFLKTITFSFYLIKKGTFTILAAIDACSSVGCTSFFIIIIICNCS